MPHQCTNCGRTFADGSKEMLSGCPDCGGNKFQFAPTAAAAADSSAGADGSVDTANSHASAPESDSVATRAAETVRDWVSTDSADESDDASSDRSQSAGSASAPQPDRAWPSSDVPDGTESNAPPDEFDEWPETARRPEDRSGSPDEVAAESAAETVGSDRTEAARPDRSSDEVTATIADDENAAQADARSEVIATDDLPSHSDSNSTDGDGAAHTVDAAGVEPRVDADDDRPPEHGRVVSEPSGQRPSIEELRAELNDQFESIKIVRPGQYELNLMELYNRDEYIISLQEDGRYVIDVPDSWRGDDDE
ncbi:OapC/ArvC family zinc-ribbon domain-containing protein [Natrinema salaciae]|uniref:Zn-ribbon containing protein n=1 Tax=Natrinema salaciae TaxID=1186196 RepID=A0A1H9IUP9_9EURY|nr:Zn-ribbon containing protein [Natrinema salaciae]SEQ78304.1 hypothetical protein SAMN04489841_2339 [Natrinema salaciae]